MNVYDPHSYNGYLSSSKKGLNWDSNPALFDAGAVLYQLTFQANSELVVMWVNDKPVDDGYRSLEMILIHKIYVFELWITNIFDPHSYYHYFSRARKIQASTGNQTQNEMKLIH